MTPGKDFGLLANGQPVTVGDRVVQPEECLEQGQKPGVCPVRPWLCRSRVLQKLTDGPIYHSYRRSSSCGCRNLS